MSQEKAHLRTDMDHSVRVSEDRIEEIRSQITNTGIVVFAVIGILPLVLSVLRTSVFGTPYATMVLGGIYALLVVMSIIHRSLSTWVRALIWIGTTFIFAITALLSWGVVGAGLPLLLFSVTITCITLGFRAGLVALIASILVFAAIATAAIRGVITFSVDMNEFVRHRDSWLLELAMFGLLASVIVASLGRLHTALLDSISVLTHRGAELQRANRDLLQEMEDRRRADETFLLDESRLDALSKLNQMAESPIHEITTFAMEEGVLLTKSTIGYLAFVNEDETVLTMHTWSKSAMTECAIDEKPIIYPVESTGLWGEAVRQRKPIVTNEYDSLNPLVRGYPEGHVPVLRHMNIPIFDGGHIVAVAGVGNKVDPYDDSDVRQLILLMETMWQHIQRKRTKDHILRQSAILDGVNRVIRGALTSGGEDGIAGTCLSMAEKLTGSGFGFIGEIDASGRFDITSLSDHGWTAMKMPLEEADLLIADLKAQGVWDRMLASKTPLIVNQLESIPDRGNTPEGRPPLTSFLGVPLKKSSRTIGMMGVANKPTGYEESDQEAVQALASAFTEALYRRRAEEELYRHREHLEDLVEERTVAQKAAYGQLAQEIAERRQAEDALVLERNLLRTLIDNLPDYIYAKDAESRFMLNNAAHLHLLRADTPEEVSGKTDYDIFPRELAEHYYTDEQEIIRSGMSLVNREEEVIDEYGNKRWLLTTKVPLKDGEGKSVGIVGMSRNITQRKLMEESLAEHTRLLERANADLEQRNRELDEFTYIASHDLQEPLRKLTAFSDVLREDMERGERDEVLQDLDTITTSAKRMRQLVQDLLALSRSGRQDMSWNDVPLNDCVERALDTLELRIEETGAEIVCEPLPTVKGDFILLSQLYQNLIGNALKFCKNRTPHVRISAKQLDGVWVMNVIDNGIGIKPEYAEQIFAPFKRLHGRGEYEGTGIGLAICRKIVERHGGRIWVESEPGKGSTFEFTLNES